MPDQPLRLNEQDRARVRYHMGYPNVDPHQAIQLGFPAATAAMFLVEQAMENLLPEAVERVLKLVQRLEKIEAMEEAALCRLKAQQLGDMKLRNDNNESTEGDLLRREAATWKERLASVLGAPLNPHKTQVTGLSSMIPVQRANGF